MPKDYFYLNCKVLIFPDFINFRGNQTMENPILKNTLKTCVLSLDACLRYIFFKIHM